MPSAVTPSARKFVTASSARRTCSTTNAVTFTLFSTIQSARGLVSRAARPCQCQNKALNDWRSKDHDRQHREGRDAPSGEPLHEKGNSEISQLVDGHGGGYSSRHGSLNHATDKGPSCRGSRNIACKPSSPLLVPIGHPARERNWQKVDNSIKCWARPYLSRREQQERTSKQCPPSKTGAMPQAKLTSHNLTTSQR